MDDPDITIEEYIQLEAEKACRRGQEFNWETATYGKESNYGVIGEVMLKEDTAYMYLHFTRNHEELKSNTPYLEDSIRRIQDQVLKDSERY
ncbi:hypothetical protein Tco_0820819 [Tanacetum coccineum]|uniref:Uncharacterized protein n=1 Tax=Tanacetum coccineum TaxID=301880 RepID=A0ABQ5AAH7_9ASTR